ncbi:hypothetical protein B7P43_G16763, partial [Cryptotermes secundus]
NAMIINLTKRKAVCFMRARVTEPPNYSLGDTAIPEASSCQYLGIILRSDLSWADQVNCTVKEARKALHFTVRVLKKGNSNTKNLACTSLVRPVLEYGAACWDPYRDGEINALDRVQKKAATAEHHRNLDTAHAGKAMLSEQGRSDKEIRSRKQRTEMGKYTFVNRTIQVWNKLPSDTLGTLSCKPSNFRKRVRKVKVGWKSAKIRSEVKSEVLRMGGVRKCSKTK